MMYRLNTGLERTASHRSHCRCFHGFTQRAQQITVKTWVYSLAPVTTLSIWFTPVTNLGLVKVARKHGEERFGGEAVISLLPIPP